MLRDSFLFGLFVAGLVLVSVACFMVAIELGLAVTGILLVTVVLGYVLGADA